MLRFNRVATLAQLRRVQSELDPPSAMLACSRAREVQGSRIKWARIKSSVLCIGLDSFVMLFGILTLATQPHCRWWTRQGSNTSQDDTSNQDGPTSFDSSLRTRLGCSSSRRNRIKRRSIRPDQILRMQRQLRSGHRLEWRTSQARTAT